MVRSIVKYPNWVDLTYTARQHLDIAKYHLKKWGGLDNLKVSGKQAMCTALDRNPVGSKNDSFNKPAPLYIAFNYDVSKGTKIRKLILHYAHKTYSESKSQANGTFPSFGGPLVSLYNENSEKNRVTLPKKRGAAPTRSYTHHTLEFTDVPIDEINVHDFGIIFAYPSNTSKNPGRIGLGDMYMEMVVETANVSVRASTVSNKVNKGNTFNVTCTVKQNDKLNYEPDLALTTSSGLEIVGKTSGNGSLTKDGVTQYWRTTLNSKYESSITVSVKAKATGRQTFKITDVDTDSSYTLTVVVNETQVDIKSIFMVETHANRNLKVDEPINYYINASTTDTSLTSMKLVIHLPSCAEIDNLAELQSIYGGKSGTTTTVNDITINKGQKTTIKGKVVSNTGTPSGYVEIGVTDNKTAILTSTATEKILTINAPIIRNGEINPIEMVVRFNDSGIWSQLIYYKNVLCERIYFTVRPKNYTELAFTRVKIPESVTSAMGDRIDYIAITRAKISPKDNTTPYTIENMKRNFRFCVMNSLKEYVDDEDLFKQHSIYSSMIQKKEWLEFRLGFTYRAEYPLYFWWSHDYLQSQNFDILDVEFQQPQLYEKAEYTTYEEPALYPKPVTALLGDTGYGTVTIPARKSTNTVYLDDWDDGGLFKNVDLGNIVIQGIQVEWDYKVPNTENIELQLRIWTNNGGVKRNGYRNITLKPNKTTNAIGDAWDTFGLTPHNLRNLNEMKLDVVLSNRGNSPVEVGLKDFKLNLHRLYVNKQMYGFNVNGERSEEYGIFLQDDFDWDFGTKNDVKYYNTSGTDIHTGYRLNIDKKELSFKFSVGDCDIEEAEHLMEKIVKLFTNERTLYNKPIPKYLIFDHMPNWVFWWIREQPFDTKIEYGNIYTCTCKLTIPEGTARNNVLTVTGSHGSNTGVARVQPKVYGNVLKDGGFTINETVTGQNISVTNTVITPKIKTGDRIVIDSENRTVELQKTGKSPENITQYVDWSSTWFSVIDEFKFTSDTVDIYDVTFRERWS